MNREAAFEVEQVSVRFGQVEALRNVSLRVAAGERVGLVGPSGAGKSTLIALLNGTQAPTSGRVWVLGQELVSLPRPALRRVQRQVGTIYQQFHLVDSLRVVHNVNAGQLGRWSFLKAALSLVWPLEVGRAAAALAQVGIPEKLYERTDRLSGGQQQRVAIARVLVQDPAAILADEPVSNLDPERSREIMGLLRGLSEQTGKTLVVSLHAIELAFTTCERLVGLREGRVAFDAAVEMVTPEMVEALYRIDRAGQ
jgi:phosphonate transport system ATP-binding protein